MGPKLFQWIERGYKVEDKENRKEEKKESKRSKKKKIGRNPQKKIRPKFALCAALKQNIVQCTTEAGSKSS